MSEAHSPDLVMVRPYRPSDADFFYRSFLDSYGRGSPATDHILKSIYYPAQHAVIDRLLKRAGTRLAVACLKDDETTLIGFVLAELEPSPVLHYVYVKAPFRRYGVGRRLIDELGLVPNDLAFSHWTYASAWLTAKWPGAKYNPYLLEEMSWKTP